MAFDQGSPTNPRAFSQAGTPSLRASLEASPDPQPPEKPVRSPETRKKEKMTVSEFPEESNVIAPEPQEEISTIQNSQLRRGSAKTSPYTHLSREAPQLEGI
ncbi:hypothetical protein HPG69_011414 [Diceros bicornis minor]|uniref:Bridging integrator 2 C-terminal tail domain-containing protein n=1 Tax=Diceros bicornis minor TaxID=77932 RepID=A0A7J7FEY5_DICBM|nr:hypothetical protein HPG69_011414 [Diceros bicornis minor]